MRWLPICAALAVLLADAGARADEPEPASPAPAPQRPAADWQPTFDPAGIAGFVRSSGPFLVVAADAGSREAATALLASLRTVAGPIMDDAGIEPMDGLDNKTIVAKLARLANVDALPAATIVVVRVFPSRPWEAPSVLVAFHDKAGSPRSLFVGVAGLPIEKPKTRRPTGHLVPLLDNLLAGALKEPRPAGPAGRVAAEAQEQYEREYIGLQNHRVERAGHLWSSLGPYQGRPRRPLSIPELYRTIDREDAARAYERRARARTIVLLVSAATLASGVVVYVVGGRCGGPTSPGGADDCHDGTVFAGLALIGTGAVGLAIAGALRPPTLPPAEVRAGVHAHNRRLRQRLGLTAMPALMPSGAGVMIGGALP